MHRKSPQTFLTGSYYIWKELQSIISRTWPLWYTWIGYPP